MKSKAFSLVRYDADDGMVFDWKDLEQHCFEDGDGNIVQEHLYAKTIFVGGNDSIDNYVEVEIPVEVEEVEGE